MRSFVQGYVLDHALFILIDYAFICLVLSWFAQLKLRSKAEGIKEELISFKWTSSVFIAHFVIPGIVMALSLTLFGADFGWLIDLFCWIAFFFCLLMWYSFFLQDETYFLNHEFVFVPAFGRRKDYYYESVRQVVVEKNSHVDKASGKVRADYSIKLALAEETETISGDNDKIKSLLVLLKERIDHSKFTVEEAGDLAEEEVSADKQSD